MNPLDQLQTPRLLLRRMGAEDLDDLVRMHLDAVSMATLGGVRAPADTAEWLTRQAEHWQRHGFGLWTVHDRASGRFVGRGGLRHVAIDGRDEIEVAYALLADFWGRGLATELARECVRVAFDVLHLPELVCFTLTTNTASQRVMQKAGFGYERNLLYTGLPHVLSRLRRPIEAGGEAE